METALRPHYEEAERMLGVVRYEHDGPADALLRRVADELDVGDTYRNVPVGVFLGQPGVRVPDPYFDGEGPPRSGCVHCGSCMLGCRHNAKNTLLKNYLFLAERLGARIIPEREVVDICPVGASADGSEGYTVTTERPGARFGRQRRVLSAGGVVVAAGALGTNRLLQRCRLNGSLTALSPRLGQRVRTNSESLLAVTAPDDRFDFSRGVAISSSIHLDACTHVEPVTFGRNADAIGGLFTLMPAPGPRRTQPLRLLATLARRPATALRLLWPGRWSRRTMLVMVMETIDTSIHLRPARRRRDGSVRMRTAVEPGRKRPAVIEAGYDVTLRLARRMGGTAQASLVEAAAGIPITAHFLGGAVIGPDPEGGVVDRDQRVFGYENLLICDGSVLPANIGVNPSLTIAALAERAISSVPPAPRGRPGSPRRQARSEAQPARAAGRPPFDP